MYQICYLANSIHQSLAKVIHMSTDQNLLALIAKASEAVGSDAKLARAMGIAQQNISLWKSGERTCTPEDRARLAGFAKEDALQELVRATLEKTAGTLRGEQLRQVLGKWLHQTGAVSVTALLGLASGTYGALSLKVAAASALDVLRCILC
jgi:DNA-binding transcriptional regulator YdaS (Cro superfamily)